MSHQKNILFGLYDDEQDLLRAVKLAKDRHLDIYDVFSPFPVHGLDPILGLQESRLHIAGFFFGLTGTLTAFLGMSWIFVSDWPLIIGGKPHLPIPSFIPVTFELTVLFAAIGMVVSYYLVNGQGPGVTQPILHERITDDKFCIAFNVAERNEEESRSFESFLRETGADEIQTKLI